MTNALAVKLGYNEDWNFSPLVKSFITSRGWEKYVIQEPDILWDPESAPWYNNAKYMYLIQKKCR